MRIKCVLSLGNFPLAVLLAISLIVVLEGCEKAQLGNAAGNVEAEKFVGSLAEQVEIALSEGRASLRAGLLASSMRKLTSDNAPAVNEVFRKRMLSLPLSDVQQFADAWSALDRDASMEAFSKWRIPSNRLPALEAALLRIATEDPEDAFVRLRNGLAKRGSQADVSLRHAIVSGWIYGDQPGLNEMLTEEGPTDTMLASVIAATSNRSGVDGLLAWFDEFLELSADRPELEKRKLVKRVVRASARRDPVRTAYWLQSNSDFEFVETASIALADGWADLDPIASMRWVAEESIASARDRSYSMAFSRWVLADIVSAEEWLLGETEADPDETRDDMWIQVAHGRIRAEREVEGMIICRDRVISAEKRTRCLGNLARRWFRRDPVSVELWLAGGNLDGPAESEVRLRIQKSIAPNKR